MKRQNKILLLVGGLMMLTGMVQAQKIDEPRIRLGLAAKAISMNSPREQLLDPYSQQMQNPTLKQVIQNLDFDAIDMEAARLMASTFTLQELEALVAFQTSPIGMSIHQKMSGFQKLVGGVVETAMEAKFKELTAAGQLQGITNQQQPVSPLMQNGFQ